MMQRVGRRLIASRLSIRFCQCRELSFLQYQVSKTEPQKSRSFLLSPSRSVLQSLDFGTKLRTQISNFASQPESEATKGSDHMGALIEALSGKEWCKETVDHLESLDLSWTNPMALWVLRRLDEDPTLALSFFNWVSTKIAGGLDSEAYSMMLEMLVLKGHMEEFWDLAERLKAAGLRMYKGTRRKIRKKFSDENMVDSSRRLDDFFGLNVEKDLMIFDEEELEASDEIVRLVGRKEEWDEEIEDKLSSVSPNISNGLVVNILKMLKRDPAKALMFFRGLGERLNYKHDAVTYNAVISVLGRRGSIDYFWAIVEEMRNSRCEMEITTYQNLSQRFQRRNMLKEAVDLYEFMVASPYTPPGQDGIFLLRRIVICDVPDWDLFARVIKIMNSSGQSVSKTAFVGILKSLTSAGKLDETKQVMKSMEEGGFVLESSLCGRAVSALCDAGMLEEAWNLFDELVKLGCMPDLATMRSPIQKYCLSGKLDEALNILQNMMQRDGLMYPDALDILVNAFCREGRAVDVLPYVSEAVNKEKLRPAHDTFKVLIQSLACQGNFMEASKVLPLMKSQGFPPFLDPLVDFISKSGTADDALGMLKAMTVKNYPANSVFLRMFKAFNDAGRHQIAQDLLYKCPSSILYDICVQVNLWTMVVLINSACGRHPSGNTIR
ncbi:Pentatricopeptide repeat-containing protein [Nymphaea thermarum]|nr:Pentatricopeptide repeat-containing protein [Nymphaea thermarum]